MKFIPQIIWFILAGANLAVNLVRHGEPREDNYNIWTSLISFVVACVLLYFGGFFNVFFR